MTTTTSTSAPTPAAGRLDGKRALVTGAGQNIGAGIARVLAEQGATVVVNDLHTDRAEAVAADIGGDTSAIAFDVRDIDAVRAGVAEAGPVDILVNNAGIPADGFPLVDFKDSDPAQWRGLIDLNLYGVLNCTHAVLAGMCDRGWGRVVTIGSEAGRTGLPIRVSLYGAAKAGARGFFKHVAHEVGPHGVTCNVVALGGMDNAPLAPSANPSRRLGSGRDAGVMVAFLASDGAEWVTGQVIGVNGGAVT
jgi:NAD(P)-dependent dehydrogenase (short-subunit alcohol dehydrogenase family)